MGSFCQPLGRGLQGLLLWAVLSYLASASAETGRGSQETTRETVDDSTAADLLSLVQ